MVSLSDAGPTSRGEDSSRLEDVPEHSVVHLGETPPSPKMQPTPVNLATNTNANVPFPQDQHHHVVELVASPDSYRDTFPSPIYPTSSSSRPTGSRRGSTASSIPPIFHSPRIAPLSPASRNASPLPSRAPSVSQPSTQTRQRSTSKSSAVSSQPTTAASSSSTSGNLSRRSSNAGLWRQSFSAGSSARARPPSTLIPAPGHEADTIPPRTSQVQVQVEAEEDASNQGGGTLGRAASWMKLGGRPRRDTNVTKERPVHIRDFAYPVGDEKYLGNHPPLVPSQPPSRTPSEAGDPLFSTTGLASLARTGSKSRRKSSFGGWTGFFGTWSRGGRDPSGNGLGLGNVVGVTKVETDLDLGDDITPSSSFVGDRSVDRVHHDVWEEDQDDEELIEGDEVVEDGPDPVGRYRAAYPFDSLGGHEMSVEEGELLDVKGRGGGIGWVVAVRLRGPRSQDELTEGLVPESYLEPAEEDHSPLA